jgi:hypothetical protein
VPASAQELTKQRVKVTRIVQTEAGDYVVKGRVHSREKGCRKNGVHLQRLDAGTGDFRDSKPTKRRGKFSIRVPQSEEGNTFRAVAERRPAFTESGFFIVPGPRCEEDKSPRFTLPPASEAGIAAAASASAAAGVVKYDTKLTIAKDRCCFTTAL